MRRRSYLEPAVLVFVLALVLSMELHWRFYGVLGEIAKTFAGEATKRAPRQGTEVSFEVAAPTPPSAPEPSRRRPARPAEQAVQKTEPPPPAPEPPPRPPQPNDDLQRQAVKQTSRDPKVEPPPNAQYLARENQRVEQETAAKLTNTERDDAKPDPGKSEARQNEPQAGNADENEVASTAGNDERNQRNAQPQARSTLAPSSPSSPAAKAGQGATAKAPAAAPAEEQETLTVRDGSGSFTIRRNPAQPRTGSAGRRDSAATGSAATPGSGLRLSWSQFENVVGADPLQRDRQAYVQRRRTRQRGGFSHKQLWTQFRAAIENYLPGVKPGNQTALNAAASPFAEYLAEVHLHLHGEFADRFLPRLPQVGTSELANTNLRTKLEIVLNADGSVHRVGVVETSGVLLFDHGAFSAVMQGAPYPSAPRSIISGDGRVYFHWGFYRNERQCGTFNAQPFILPNPSGTPSGTASGRGEKPG